MESELPSEDEAARESVAVLSLLAVGGFILYALLCYSRRDELDWPPIGWNALAMMIIFGSTHVMCRRAIIPIWALDPLIFVLGMMVLNNVALGYRCGFRENIMSRLMAVMVGGSLYARRVGWLAVHLLACLYCAKSLLGPPNLHVMLTLFIGTLISLSANHSRRQEMLSAQELHAAQDEQNFMLERTLDKARELSGSLDVTVAQRTSHLVKIHLELTRTLQSQLALFEERSRLELQMQEGLRLESVGRAAGTAAHDFNNMLAILSCAVELLQEMRPDDPDLEVICLATERISQLGKEILTLSGRQLLQQENVAVSTLASEWGPMLTGLLGDKYQFHQDIESPQTLLECDKQQLLVVLAKLLVNAAEAMPGGGPIDLVGKCIDPKTYQLELTDRGPGIPEDLRETVFDPFFTSKDRDLHSGLGLSTARAILLQHGGSIQVDHRPGGGGLVRLTLPIRTEGS